MLLLNLVVGTSRYYTRPQSGLLVATCRYYYRCSVAAAGVEVAALRSAASDVAAAKLQQQAIKRPLAAW